MTRRGVLLLAAVVVVAVAVVLVLTLPGIIRGDGSDDSPPGYVIAIDAGHGGRDPGAMGGGIEEKDLNLQIANRLVALVDAEPDLIAKQIRTLDIFIDLEERIRMAEAVGAVLYIAVHVNSYSNEEPEGVETIVDNTRELDSDSWVLAELVQDGVTNSTGARDRGTRSQESYLQHAEIPALTVETGYITNPAERAKLVDPAYQELIAQGILDGIRQYITWKHPEEMEEQ